MISFTRSGKDAGTYKVITTRRETLHDGHFVPMQLGASLASGKRPREEEGSGPHDAKVEDHGYENAESRAEMVEDVGRLFGKDYDDCVEETDLCEEWGVDVRERREVVLRRRGRG